MVEGVIIFMKIITLFEHEQLILSDASPLRQSHFYHLEKINQQAGVELIHIGYKRIKAKSYVGVIQIGDVTIQILPKVDITGQDNSKSESSVKSAVSNLLWMLIYAGELPVKESEISPLTRMKGNLFEIFVKIYCDRLLEELGKGIFRNYQEREETVPLLKGRWLIDKQLREKPLMHNKFIVSYSDFTEDNSLNRILYYTVCYLRRMSDDIGNKNRLDILKAWFDEVELPNRITSHDIEKVTFTRLNVAFKPIFDLACTFLFHETMELSAGKTPIFSFLFDMNVLFERFIAGFIRCYRDKILPDAYKNCELLIQSRGDQRWLARNQKSDGRLMFRLRPDIVLRQSDHSVPLIVDTKYKIDQRIAEGDAYQMHAYATCFECPEILILYPVSYMVPQNLSLENPSSEIKPILRTYTINLRHDLSKARGREDLSEQLRQSFGG